MMIETKGTRTEAGADGAQPYASQGAGPKPGTPYYLALAVAALAAYLKSLFHQPVHAEAVVEAAEAPHAAGPRLVVLPAAEQAPDAVPSEPRITGSAGMAPVLDNPASEYDASHPHAQALHFARHDPQPNLNDFKASPVIPRPTNDNGGSHGGGGVHGGGGGGRDDTPSGAADPETRPHPEGDAIPDMSGPHTPKPSGPGQPAGTQGDQGGTPRDGGDGGTPRDGSDGGAGPAGKVPAGDGTGDPGGRRNRAPVATGPVHLADTTGCALLAIAMNDLLQNVQDPDGDPLTVRNVTVSSGSLARDGDGWVFDGDGPGPVTVAYEVTDGEFAIAQTASFDVVARNAIAGSGDDDLILGTPCADDIAGGAGGDIIDARGGADLIDGGAGDDHIVAGAGDDTVLGGAGDDVIFAGAGADVVSGGAGNDRIFGEAGNDILLGDAGDDLLDGGEGSDVLVGASGADLLFGGTGDDRIDGGEGNDQAFGDLGRDIVSGGDGDDRLEGGGGDDVLADGGGRDVALGQDGDDVLVAARDGAEDVLDGGDGADTLDLTATTMGVSVDLAAGVSAGSETGRDRLVSIETVRGGSGDDVLLGSSAAETLAGGAGEDRLAGGGGDDRLEGGPGADALSDGAGSDVVSGGAGDDAVAVALDGEADRFDGGEGRDTLDLSATREGVTVDLAAGTSSGAETGQDLVSGLEAVIGGSGGDGLSGGEGNDSLSGGGGDDRLAGRSGDDVLEGGAGADTVLDGAGCDIVRAGAGNDRVVLALDGDDDRVDGGDGFDTLDVGAASGNLLVDLVHHVVSGTELGADRVESMEAIVSGSGHDRFVVGDEDVVLTGGGGNDGYAFAVAGKPEATRAVQITDFSVGDYVDLLKWTLFEACPTAIGRSLSEAMERSDGTMSGIQYKSALLDEGDVTVISADLDHDDRFETTIVLDGRHTLLFVETPEHAAGVSLGSPTT
ncbi:cadherin-like domain-containing protein [Methylobacterium sp. M6A4_1b]